jgi:hypothetical protein
MALRAAPAKGLAIVTIAGTFVAAAILLVWPVPTKSPGGSALITARVIPIQMVQLPRATRDIAVLPRAARRHAAAHGAMRTKSGATVALAAAPAPRAPAPESQLVPAADERPLLASRSSATASDLVRMSSVPVDRKEPSRPPGALTRAMGTTADAFRTAGSSVAGAFKKVF